jgi:hypothetical protein
MNSSTASKSLSLPNLNSLRALLNLLASMRDLSNPFSSIDDLRRAIELFLDFGTTLGFDSNWLIWLQKVHDNPELLNLLLATGQYLESILAATQPTPTSARQQRAGSTAPVDQLDEFAHASRPFASIARAIPHLGLNPNPGTNANVCTAANLFCSRALCIASRRDARRGR